MTNVLVYNVLFFASFVLQVILQYCIEELLQYTKDEGSGAQSKLCSYFTCTEVALKHKPEKNVQVEVLTNY